MAKILHRTSQVPKTLMPFKESRAALKNNPTPIETIMRERKQYEEQQEQIMSQGKALEGVDLDEADAITDVTKGRMIDRLLQTSRAFTYEKQDQFQGRQSMVGVSRTQSTSLFTKNTSRHKLSFLPPLTKPSIGKFTPLH